MSIHSYTVISRDGMRFVSGDVPLVDMGALLREWASGEELPHGHPDEWVVDAVLSERLGVNMACGSREAINAEFRRLDGPCSVLADPPAIRCNTCGRISHSAEDVARRFCGHCNKFHDLP